MCGIVGIVNLDGRPASIEQEGAFLRAAAARIGARGPDDETFLFRANAAFAFRRLSIVDIAGGRQPFVSRDGQRALLVNGEIFNHRSLRAGLRQQYPFATSSDCEVLLALYEEKGDRFLDDVNGIFGLALLDLHKRRLLLARDRLGVKPLYVARTPSLLIVGSEIKALLAHPAIPHSLNWNEAVCGEEDLALPSATRRLPSFFDGIESIPAAHLLTVDLDGGATTATRYWDPAAAASRLGLESASADAFVHRYRDLLEDAISLQLMADAECGLFLSGGLDSTAIAALAAGGSPLHSFTAVSASTIGNGDARSAHEVARHVGLPSHFAVFDFARSPTTPERWKQILWAVEHPLANQEFLYKYELHAFAKAIRPSLKVMLIGQGSDEFNGGYSRIWCRNEEEPADWRAFERAVGRRLRSEMVRSARLTDSRFFMGRSGRSPFRDRFFAQRLRENELSTPFDAYRTASFWNLQAYNLWHEDRTAAANSIENRVPFLDHRLVELTFAVPPSLQPELFWEKAILRRAVADLLPPSLRNRGKDLFRGDDALFHRRMMMDLLRADGGALVEEALSVADEVLDADSVRALLDEEAEDTELRSAGRILSVVNMALLHGMAKQAPAPMPRPTSSAYEIAFADLNDHADRLLAATAVPDEELGARSILRLADNVQLVRPRQRTSDSDEVPTYVVIDGQLELEISEDVARVLDCVDGARSLEQLEQASCVASVREHMTEALRLGLVEPVRRDGM